MIAFTYAASGMLLAVTGFLFAQGRPLGDDADALPGSVIFFFASAAASAAYLTVSETFPLEIRALAIAFFYAVGTGIGGIIGPCCSAPSSRPARARACFGGYLLGAVLMLAAAVVAGRWAVAAERKPLEEVARPLAQA